MIYCGILWYTNLELIEAEEVSFSYNISGNGANRVVSMGLIFPSGLGKRLLELMDSWREGGREGGLQTKFFSR